MHAHTDVCPYSRKILYNSSCGQQYLSYLWLRCSLFILLELNIHVTYCFSGRNSDTSLSLNKTITEYGYVLIGDNTISTKSDRRQWWSLNIIFHNSFYIFEPNSVSLHQSNYRQVSNISRTSVGNKNVDLSDVVGASPVGAAPTTSSFST